MRPENRSSKKFVRPDVEYGQQGKPLLRSRQAGSVDPYREKDSIMTKTAISAVTAAVLALTALHANARDGYDRSFRFVNQSNAIVYSIHATDVATDSWGPDLLGNDVVQPGESTVVRPRQNRGYCRYDVRIVFNRANGPSQTIPNVNLCELRELATNGNGPRYGRLPYILTFI